MKTVLIAIVFLSFKLIAIGQSDSSFTNKTKPRQIPCEPIGEIGGAANLNFKGGGWNFGADLAVEVTPIENWLELEAGVTPTFATHATEWETDFLLKKPWTFSPNVEFMPGAGPAWIHERASGVTTNSVSVEAALDFMFWPSPKHRFGWYFEPGYEYNFGKGHEQSVGISCGLLVAIR
jgi:hypothetical protein